MWLLAETGRKAPLAEGRYAPYSRPGPRSSQGKPRAARTPNRPGRIPTLAHPCLVATTGGSETEICKERGLPFYPVGKKSSYRLTKTEITLSLLHQYLYLFSIDYLFTCNDLE
jgi:hypothetical protein